jgi:hypothetical protein
VKVPGLALNLPREDYRIATVQLFVDLVEQPGRVARAAAEPSVARATAGAVTPVGGGPAPRLGEPPVRGDKWSPRCLRTGAGLTASNAGSRRFGPCEIRCPVTGGFTPTSLSSRRYRNETNCDIAVLTSANTSELRSHSERSGVRSSV